MCLVLLVICSVLAIKRAKGWGEDGSAVLQEIGVGIKGAGLDLSYTIDADKNIISTRMLYPTRLFTSKTSSGTY